MGQTQAVIQYAQMKIRQICDESKDKPIPNWWKIEDVMGFGIRISEGELNFQIGISIYPVEEFGEGNFLIKLHSNFLSKPANRHGYEFIPMPIGPIFEMDTPMYAEGEQELQNGILQWIHEEAENILSRILQ